MNKDTKEKTKKEEKVSKEEKANKEEKVKKEEVKTSKNKKVIDKKEEKKKENLLLKDISKGKLIIEAVVYVVGLLYGIYLYNVGGYYVNLIPIVFILGLVGKVVFDRPITTTILGMIFHGFISYQIYGITLNEILLSSLYVGIMLMAGEIIGQIYFLMYQKKKLKNRAKKVKIKSTKTTKGFEYNLPFSVAVIVFAVLVMHSYVSGNIVEFIFKRAKVDKYVKETYQEHSKNLEIGMPKINLGLKAREYQFYIIDKATGTPYELILRNNNYIEDSYYETRCRYAIIEKNNKIAELLKARLESSAEYKNVSVVLGSNKLIVTKMIDEKSDKEIKTFSNQLYQILYELRINNLLEEINGVDVKLENKDKEILAMMNLSKQLVQSELFTSSYFAEGVEEKVIDVN